LCSLRSPASLARSARPLRSPASLAPTKLTGAQIELASNSDLCLFFLQTSSGEGSDRDNLNLNADGKVAEVASHCAKSVAVVSAPGAVLMPWADSVDSMLVNFMPGVASAFATVDILVGDEEPTGRLPITMPLIENQEGMTLEQFPGVDGNMNSTYTETWGFGYRYYHLHQEEPRFWFGAGLGYSSFEVTKISWGDSNVKVSIKNTGDVDSTAVPQLYLGAPSGCDLPLWALKGFDKLLVKAGESANVEFALDEKDVSKWDVDARDWAMCGGEWSARVGFSAQLVDDETIATKTI
jgi:beta-glucosidase